MLTSRITDGSQLVGADPTYVMSKLVSDRRRHADRYDGDDGCLKRTCRACGSMSAFEGKADV